MSESEREENERDDEDGGLAVPGPDSHERDETLSPDERGTEGEPVPPPSEPEAP